MNTRVPKQLSLPLRPPKGPTMADVMRRVTRIESRLVQLMKHQGMKDDGHSELPEDKGVPA